MKKNIAKMLNNLCCSVCKSDFDENSVKILREEKNTFVLKLECKNCGKSFGVALLHLKDLRFEQHNINDIILNIQEDLPPIVEDDVLNAHDFIKNMDKNWSRYLQ